jgi:hypothetical protein
MSRRTETVCHHYGFILVLCTYTTHGTANARRLRDITKLLDVSVRVRGMQILDFCRSCIILAAKWIHSHLHWICTFVLYHGNAYAS